LEYFGPSRLQVQPDVRAILEEMFRALPKHLRVNLADGNRIESEFTVPTIAETVRGDPSEAPRSGDLHDLLFSSFPIIDRRPMGGTLLRPFLAYRAGNYRSESDLCILTLLRILERELIKARAIESDHEYFVLGKSDRL
jgi:hypothetical protein